MAKARARGPLRLIVDKVRRWHNPVLARTLSDLRDDEIDDTLVRAGLTREDLFAPDDAIAQHRDRLALMLATLGIDIGQVIRDHWASLKHADQNCARCTQTDLCHRWLEGGTPNIGPKIFCPNATFFMSIGAEQERRFYGWY